MKKQSGIVLYVILLVILIISEALILMFGYANTFVKTNNEIRGAHDSFYNLESATYSFLKKRAHGLTVGKGSYPFAGTSYKYQVEDAGNYDCLVVRDGSAYFSSQHWIVSMQSQQHSMLKIRFSQRGQVSQCREEQLKIVRNGILSWQYNRNHAKPI